MIVKVNTGSDAARVTDYLTRRQERARDGERVELHTDPHLIAGSPVAYETWAGRELDSKDARVMARWLEAPHRLYGRGLRDHIVTLAVSLPTDEPSGAQRTDEWWAQVAQDVVDGMRLDGARWLAVRHGVSAAGNDHVHLVVDLTRDDGSRLDMRFYKRRAVRTARALERKHGLEPPAERRARRVLEAKRSREAGPGREPSYAPSNDDRLRARLLKAARASRSVEELGDALTRQGVLVRWRTDKTSRKVIGGSIALADGGKPVYRPFGKLHKQLAWPHLSQRLAKNAAAPARSPVREPPAMYPGGAHEMSRGQPPEARIARDHGPGLGPPGIER